MLMLPCAAFLIQHQQTRSVPLCDRRLGDQFFRQIKVKIFRSHVFIPIPCFAAVPPLAKRYYSIYLLQIQLFS